MTNLTRTYLSAAIGLTLALFLSTSVSASETSVKVGVKKNMNATLIAPDGPGPYPGVLVLHTSSGLQQADLAYARKLAEQGYVCLVPAFMDTYGITGKTRQQTFTGYARDIYNDFLTAIDFLKSSDKVAGGKVGAIGFSNGGYFAMWLAATAKVDAGVSYYGALNGAGTDKELTRFSSTFDKNSAPVLILHGSDDRTVPVGAAQHLGGIVKSAGSPYELKIYDGADHVFERDLRNDAQKAAAADAWQKTQAFFAKWLGSSTQP
jgi:carboxymethylenebutenolidase